MAAALLALLGAASWGVGDFFGGLAARRAHVLTVLALSQVVGLLGAIAWVVLAGEGAPGWPAILAGAGAGVAGAVGLAALYRGLAIGAMGIVAPISAVYRSRNSIISRNLYVVSMCSSGNGIGPGWNAFWASRSRTEESLPIE